jgi:hypothetical protein
MYIMEVSFGSYKMRLEIFLLIIFLIWVMFGHALCSCCTMSFREGLETISETVTGSTEEKEEEEKEKDAEVPTNGSEQISANLKEAFGNGNEFAKNNDPGYIMDPNTWAMGATVGAGVGNIANRKPQQFPLPEGQMDIMENMEFKPECCPNTYSSSEGCACMDMATYQYLENRGGNNVPFSEY